MIRRVGPDVEDGVGGSHVPHVRIRWYGSQYILKRLGWCQDLSNEG